MTLLTRSAAAGVAATGLALSLLANASARMSWADNTGTISGTVETSTGTSIDGALFLHDATPRTADNTAGISLFWLTAQSAGEVTGPWA